MTERVVYNSRDFAGGTERPFEYRITHLDGGSLRINFRYFGGIENIIRFTNVRYCTELIFQGENWNLRSSTRGTLRVIMYNAPKEYSEYPAECFTTSGISREDFTKQIILEFNECRMKNPKAAGPIVNELRTDFKPKTTQGEEAMKSMNVSEIAKELVSDNAQFAKFEAERKIGQTALDFAVNQFVNQFPSAKPFADTPVGKLVIANTFRIAGNMYSGKNKETVDVITSAIMRGSYASLGDSFNFDNILDGFVDKFKNLIPSLGADTKSESSEAK